MGEKQTSSREDKKKVWRRLCWVAQVLESETVGEI